MLAHLAHRAACFAHPRAEAVCAMLRVNYRSRRLKIVELEIVELEIVLNSKIGMNFGMN